MNENKPEQIFGATDKAYPTAEHFVKDENVCSEKIPGIPATHNLPVQFFFRNGFLDISQEHEDRAFTAIILLSRAQALELRKFIDTYFEAVREGT